MAKRYGNRKRDGMVDCVTTIGPDVAETRNIDNDTVEVVQGTHREGGPCVDVSCEVFALRTAGEIGAMAESLRRGSELLWDIAKRYEKPKAPARPKRPPAAGKRTVGRPKGSKTRKPRPVKPDPAVVATLSGKPRKSKPARQPKLGNPR